MSKIYTKTGDQGTSGLLGGKRVSKSFLALEAYGTLDELNSYLGWALVLNDLASLKAEIEFLQRTLFQLGSLLAAPPEKRTQFQLKELGDEPITLLEQWIDEATAEMPPLTQFILPGGDELAARLHIARTICRRAERVLAHPELKEWLPENALKWVNRLSDYLFTRARWVNHRRGRSETTWNLVE